MVDMKLEVVVLPVRAELADRGAEMSEVCYDAGGVFHHAGTEGRVPGPAPSHKTYGSFISSSDPDGNGWFVQEMVEEQAGPPGSAGLRAST